MKINKKGSQCTSSAQHLVFHSRKHSLNEPITLNTLAHQNALVQSERGFSFVPSESQSVLKKANEADKKCAKNVRYPSNSIVQQNQNQEKEGSYMLKIQKYKKMKTELNNQTKSILKKCMNDTGQATGQNPQKSSASLLQSQTTKHSTTQQLVFGQSSSKVLIDSSTKENSNQASNYNSCNSTIKANTLKFSINNLLNEITSRTGAVQGVSNYNSVQPPNSSVNLKQNQIALKNHTSLMQAKGSQVQLASAKMMMALHKKCNSITSGSQINIQPANVPKHSNSSCVDILSQERQSLENSQQPPMLKSQRPYLRSDTHKNELKKNLSQLSQIEFFDENVKINEVPQITPRYAEKRKGYVHIQPNERYKEVDEQQQTMVISANNYQSVPVAVLTDLTNRQTERRQQEPQYVKINLAKGVVDSQADPKIPSSVRYAKENDRHKAFEMKRRSCGEVDHHFQSQTLHKQKQLSSSQQAKLNSEGQFTQRKFSHQVTVQSNDAKIPTKVAKQFLQQTSAREKLNPKDEIISYIGKYIKQQNPKGAQRSPQQVASEVKEYEETLQNLKDFLQYLEDKKIINTKHLENNKEEMSNLIQDLMKLDLNKFASNNKPKGARHTIEEQPTTSSNLTHRRNSADQVVIIDAENMPTAKHMGSPLSHQGHLPVNSPNTRYDQQKYVCYYSPVNVSGNNNVVNTNVQVYPTNVHGAIPKGFNCSQKLFLHSPDHNNNPILNNDSQDVPLRIPVQTNSNSHKRVNSMADSQALNQSKKNIQTPVVVNSRQLNFGFGQNNITSQRFIPGVSEQDQQAPQQRNGAHFHQRKHSMFLQVNPNNSQITLNQTKENQEDEEAQTMKSKFHHRRATTNFQVEPHLKPTANQPSQMSSIEAFFNDDIGMLEDREKLIKYIKQYTLKRLEAPETTLEYYKFVKLIGKGAFGKVTLGIHKLTGKQVAIKTVDKSLMKDEYQRNKVLQEVHLLKKVRHSNVIRLLEVFESSKHLLMVMEYAGGGDLLQYVKKRRRLEEPEARRIFKQVVYGLAHCHCRSVLHRDIKLDNILLDNDGEIKICDFGVSRIIKKHQRITEQCGTPAYIAPEIISDVGYEGFSADIWSLGVLLYAMLCGTVPFKAQNMHDLHQIITNGYFEFPSYLNGILSPQSKDLITRMLVLDPSLRISIPEILSHDWMSQGSEFDCEEPLDMHSIAQNNFLQGITTEEGDINSVNVDNLFKDSEQSYSAKLSYTDYCSITQDFATMHIDEEALQVLEGFGFPRKLVKDGINKGELNQATASYNLLVLS